MIYELRGVLIDTEQMENSDDWDQHSYEFVKYLLDQNQIQKASKSIRSIFK